MISTKYKFLYIHIPKTGGNSIQTALGPYSDDQLVFRNSMGNVVKEDGTQGLDVFNEKLGFGDPRHKHATLSDYYEIMGEDIFSYFMFTSVSNPWDRVISQTAFLTPGGLRGGRLKRLRGGRLKKEELILPISMLDYVSIDGQPRMEDFVRFESLQQDFDRICSRIGIPISHLPHKNRSIRRSYRDYYTEETKAYVQDRFRRDIEYFGYEY